MTTLKQQVDALKQEVDYLRHQLMQPQTKISVSKKETLLNYLGKSKAFNEFLNKIPEDDTNFLDHCEWDFKYHPIRKSSKIRKGDIVVDETGNVYQETEFDNTNWDAREKIAEQIRGCSFVKEVKPNGIIEYYFED